MPVPMSYVSTRGNTPPLSFCNILLGGLMPDGGLAMPAAYPRISPEELSAMRGMTYAELAFAILSLYATDIPSDVLRDICDRTYTAETYSNGRLSSDCSEITPLRRIDDNIWLQELSNGPTLAFKDMAMQLLGNLFEYALGERGETINILGATSGDTGSAAEYAMRGKKGIKVFMLSPENGMSEFQRAQMYSLRDPNIFNLAVRGRFDDAQDVVKAVSNDADFKARYKIGAVNSINWARVVAQVVYYFKGYLALTKSNDEAVDFVVPSGNFGNICAGHVARMMGLPIRKLVLATNENNVLDEFFRTGIYRPRNTDDVHVTSSPSMDISKASNFERFVFDLVCRDAGLVASLWKTIDAGGRFDLSQSPHWPMIRERFGFVSGSSTHQDRIDMIREVQRATGITIDPHTADGMKVAMETCRMDGVPMIVLETALPAKFENTILEATGKSPWRPTATVGIEALPQRFWTVDPNAQTAKDFIVAHA